MARRRVGRQQGVLGEPFVEPDPDGRRVNAPLVADSEHRHLALTGELDLHRLDWIDVDHVEVNLLEGQEAVHLLDVGARRVTVEDDRGSGSRHWSRTKTAILVKPLRSASHFSVTTAERPELGEGHDAKEG